jgi:CubicO group peptidase (beta-lactamase class C family)
MRPTRRSVLAFAAASLSATPSLGFSARKRTPPLADQLLRDARAEGFSGAVLVARGRKVVFDHAYGAPHGTALTTQSRFWIASAGKQFVSTAVLTCVDRGRLTLDDPLVRFFPDAPADKRAITVRQLLSHTSGLGQSYTGEDQPDRATAVARMLAVPLAAAPGAGFHYSNSNFQLAAAIVEVISGADYKTFAREQLWRPAGLGSTGFAADAGAASVSPARQATPERLSHAEWGEEGVYSTTGDLWRWWRALQDGKVLSSASLAALFAPGVQISEGEGALGWFRGRSATGARTIFTRGNEDYGPNSAIYAYPDTGVVAIVLTHAGDSPHDLSWSRRIIAEIEASMTL